MGQIQGALGHQKRSPGRRVEINQSQRRGIRGIQVFRDQLFPPIRPVRLAGKMGCHQIIFHPPIPIHYLSPNEIQPPTSNQTPKINPSLPSKADQQVESPRGTKYDHSGTIQNPLV
ncbi:hypothetical protein DSO57_1014075 [Entomophthora muscae]|uniref:Uncharacterized protein n=1 Tax=Entomophthora muscae TaxID=34485 RepID=A0ACC2TGN9_9FUNG|nr:hypothetical protein DSO57_1014075 [Entomophthora muscae]